MKIRKSTIIVHIIAWSAALIWILPFLGVFMVATRPWGEINHGWWNFAEFNPSFKNFVDAWNHSSAPLGQGMFNSFLVAIPSTLIPMFVA